MVSSATSYSGNGLRDFLIQRLTAVIIGIYVLTLFGFFLFNAPVGYDTWLIFMSHTGMKVFSILTLLSLCAHAWIGVWTIYTDYLKPAALRLVVEMLTVVALFGFLIWGLLILWRI